MHKEFHHQIYPTEKQQVTLDNHLEAFYLSYNRLLKIGKMDYERGGISLSYFQQQRTLHHPQSRKIVNQFRVIQVEEFHVNRMVYNHCLAKSISDAYSRNLLIRDLTRSIAANVALVAGIQSSLRNSSVKWKKLAGRPIVRERFGISYAKK